MAHEEIIEANTHIRVMPTSKNLLKKISDHTGEKHYRIIHRILKKELKRLKLDTPLKEVA